VDFDYCEMYQGLHQGSILSPYSFILILDVLTKHNQELPLRCMHFANDVVLLVESMDELNRRLETSLRSV